MSHLEALLAEYYDWQGYVVKRNMKVGSRRMGGWEMELDIVAFNPENRELLHIESSLDSNSWAKREKRFAKKFDAGKKYIHSEVFTWLKQSKQLKQIAVFPSVGKNRISIAGGIIRTVDDYMKEIRTAVIEKGLANKSAISEQYQLLRTLQLALCGYSRKVRLSFAT